MQSYKKSGYVEFRISGVFFMGSVICSLLGWFAFTPVLHGHPAGANTAPAAPSILPATPVSNTQIDLKWIDNSTDETGFTIERKTPQSVGTYKPIATVGANVTSFSDTGLSANTPYFYRVRADNNGGSPTYSNETSATTLRNRPFTPGILTATPMSNTQVNLTWQDNSTNEAGFKIERKTPQSGGAYKLIAMIGANVTSFLNTGLSPNTPYFYRVYAYNNGGNSAYSNDTSATTWRNPPVTPDNLTATPVSYTQINLTWQDKSTNEAGFKVERKTDTEVTYTEIATIGANVARFSNTGLNSGVKYFYRVRAFNNGGNSAFSNIKEAMTLPNPPALPAPSHLTATPVSNTRISLAWRDNSNNEDGFLIERKIGAAGTYRQIEIEPPLSVNVTSYTDVTLTGSTQYFYRVRAFNASGYSLYSNEASAATFPAAPAAPSNLIATVVGSSQINLAWTDNSANEDGFKIERKNGVSGSYAEIATVGANVTSFSSTGLFASTQYFFRIRAVNVGGNSAYSNETFATTLMNEPGNVVAIAASSSQINLTWTDNTSNESGFQIERSTTAGGPFTLIGTTVQNATSFSNTGLTAGTQYFYRVRAVNATNVSGYSNPANATTLPNLPTPSNLIAFTVSNTRIGLSWTDNSTNEDGFVIERRTGGADSYEQIAIEPPLGANVTSYTDIGTECNILYFYRVRAFNASGYSDYSNESGAGALCSPPNPPSGLIATAVSNTQINLAWTDNTANETGFKIELTTSAGGPYTEIATVGANVTSFFMTGLSANTQYFIRIRAFNASGNSAYSNEVSVTTLSDPPAAPSDLDVTAVSNTQIDLAWFDNSSTETGFKIERSATGSAGLFTQIASVGPNVKNYSNTGLTANTPYWYRAAAYNASGDSPYSNVATAMTHPLAAPSNLIFTTTGTTRVNLTWTDKSTNEDGFLIERKTGAADTYAPILPAVGANVTSHIDFTQPGITYYYRLRAFNASGYSSYSNEVSITTPQAPPNAPSNLTAFPVSNAQINLAWTDNSNNEDGFKIERKLISATTFTLIATVNSSVTSIIDNGLSGGTAYSYRIRAFNASGFSAFSNVMTGITLFDPPAAPSNLTATAVSNTQIDLAWFDNSSTETGFKIERSATGSVGSFTQIASVGPNVQNYSNTGLTSNTPYWYRVAAYNAGSDSPYSNVVTATTHPLAAPSSLFASTVSNTRIHLVWTDSSTNEDGFQIERKTPQSGAGTYAQIMTVPANVTSFTDITLTGNTEYFFRIRAFNASGYSSYSNEDSATTLAADPGNIALNKPIVASSTEAGSTPTRANDGNIISFWRSGAVSNASPIAWLRVELGSSPVTVARGVIVWNQFYHATQYEIQVSNDGANWTIVHTNNAGTNATQDISFVPVAARYVRAYLKMPNSGSYRMTEFKAYATGAISKTGEQTAAKNAIIPEEIMLEQNYPNPFSANGTFGNPSTMISFSLPAGAHVSLKVLNVAGQEVATLMNGYRDRGIHRVTFNAKKLPSGVYYAVLQAGDVTQMQRMLYTK